MWDTYHTRGIRTKHLYRFMKLEWGLEFLKTNQMYMSRMDGFEDKFEGIATGNIVTLGLLPLINRNFSYHPQLPNKGIDNIKKIAKQKLIAARQQLAKIQCSNYVSCWFMSDRESVAMWDLYAGINGIAIQLDRKKFQNRIKDMLLDNKLSFVPKSVVAGKVAYHDFHRISRTQRSHMMKYLPFRKDVSFEHEKEYRITLNMGDSILDEKGLNYPLGSIIDLEIKVIASPRMSDEQFEKTQKLLHDINPQLIFQQSELRPLYKFLEMEN